MSTTIQGVAKEPVSIAEKQFQVPVLTGKANNPLLRIKVSVPPGQKAKLTAFKLDVTGTTDLSDIAAIRVFYFGQDSLAGTMYNIKRPVFGTAESAESQTLIRGNQSLAAGDHYFWISVQLRPEVNLQHMLGLHCSSLTFDGADIQNHPEQDIRQRVGVAVRQHGQDGVHTSRIPGLATTNKGTLLAIFDARYDKGGDLQGNIDIGLHRSEDGGKTWQPIQIVLDMGEWGGLPEKFNGVSDPCILVDKTSGDIYIAGTWMYGVLDQDGKWIPDLDANSKAWNHQWRDKGSQPGFDVKQSAQFLITKSTDDGKTWTKPMNITRMGKKEAWWLWAPAPGQGITLSDGTLVFPTQGRDEKGEAFSNISYSKDGGKTWKASDPALAESTTECMVVERTDGSLMLNMRANSNKDRTGAGNGRAVATTRDLGHHWQEHPTSHEALPEPVCMASVIGIAYQQGREEKHLLFFSNPHSTTKRHRMTIQISDDEGLSWNKYRPLLLDEGSSRGYSCLTGIDDETIGILYESSQADLVFQAIKIKDLLVPIK
ncbi:sialidase family protein [Olivibacter ginsenosidimutans]|uniref:sialidase family protein n=1 Tax=Olivibacter ginsenosidimutans TaxID=1176537 RepID=UPI0031E9347C